MSRNRLSYTAGLLIALTLGSHSCNLTRYAIRKSGPVMNRALGVLSSYEDPELARQAAPALLALLEGLLASDPENPTLLALLCQGLYEYTFGFVQSAYERLREQDPEAAEKLRLRARSQYVKVYELGLRMLRIHGVRITLQKSSAAEIGRQLRRVDKRAVPAMTWTAIGAGSALQLGLDQPWLMQMISKIPLLLKRAVALDAGYANALPVGALALYYGRDLMTGGSAIGSQRYFLRAIELTKRRYLLWLLLYARHWAWQFQSVQSERVGTGAAARLVDLRPRDKRRLFQDLLAEIERFPLQSAPKLRLANTIAQGLARRLAPKLNDFLGDRSTGRRTPRRHAAHGGKRR